MPFVKKVFKKVCKSIRGPNDSTVNGNEQRPMEQLPRMPPEFGRFRPIPCQTIPTFCRDPNCSHIPLKYKDILPAQSEEPLDQDDEEKTDNEKMTLAVIMFFISCKGNSTLKILHEVTTAADTLFNATSEKFFCGKKTPRETIQCPENCNQPSTVEKVCELFWEVIGTQKPITPEQFIFFLNSTLGNMLVDLQTGARLIQMLTTEKIIDDLHCENAIKMLQSAENKVKGAVTLDKVNEVIRFNLNRSFGERYG